MAQTEYARGYYDGYHQAKNEIMKAVLECIPDIPVQKEAQ